MEDIDVLSLKFVSSICAEIIASKSIDLHAGQETLLAVLKSFRRDSLRVEDVYEDVGGCCKGHPPQTSLHWRYSEDHFLKIKDFFTASAFLNMAPVDQPKSLFFLIRDADRFDKETRMFLEILDLMELRKEKEKVRSKYDLKSEADEIQEQILKLQEEHLHIFTPQKIFIKENRNQNSFINKNVHEDTHKESINLENRHTETCFSKNLKVIDEDITSIGTNLTKEKIATTNIENYVSSEIKTNLLKESEAVENLKVFSEQQNNKIEKKNIINLEIVTKRNSINLQKINDCGTDTLPVVILKEVNKNFDENSSQTNDTKSYSTADSWEINGDIRDFIQSILENIVKDIKKVVQYLEKEEHTEERKDDKLFKDIFFENEQLKEILQDEAAACDERDILLFALRKMPVGRCYTADLCSGYSIIDCLKKGWPKSKKILVSPPEIVIERKIKKEPKSSATKRDKDSKNNDKSRRTTKTSKT